MHIEVIDDDTNEEIEGEEWAEDDEEDEVQVHEDSLLPFRLLIQLQNTKYLRQQSSFIFLSFFPFSFFFVNVEFYVSFFIAITFLNIIFNFLKNLKFSFSVSPSQKF